MSKYNIAIACGMLLVMSNVNLCIAEEDSAPAGENLALGKVVIKEVLDSQIIRGEDETKTFDLIDPTGKLVGHEKRGIAQILRIGNTAGASDYKNGKDFTASGPYIIWKPEENRPSPGQTYFVSYTYVYSEKSHNSASHGGHMTDGNPNSTWVCEATNWVYVDLETPQAVGKVVLKQAGGEYAPREMKIQYASEGAGDLENDDTWTDVISTDDKIKNPMIDVLDSEISFTIKPVTARYFRVFVQKGRKPEHNFGYLKQLELYTPE